MQDMTANAPQAKAPAAKTHKKPTSYIEENRGFTEGLQDVGPDPHFRMPVDGRGIDDGFVALTDDDDIAIEDEDEVSYAAAPLPRDGKVNRRRVPHLTRAQERAHGLALRNPAPSKRREAEAALVGSHLDMARGRVTAFVGSVGSLPPQFDFEHAHAAGEDGLLDACKYYDPAKGTFRTFARLHVDGRIKRYASQCWSAVHVPASAGPKKWVYDSSVDAKRVDDAKGQDIPGDCALNPSDALTEEEPSPEDILVNTEDAASHRAAFLRALNMLTPRDRAIFVARRMTEDQPTLQKLGVKFGLSDERVRQIEYAATVTVYKTAPKALARLEANRTRIPETIISPAQARFYGRERNIVATLFKSASSRTYRERCQAAFEELVALGDPPLRAVQRMRWTILRWCRNGRAVVRAEPSSDGVPYRSLVDGQLTGLGGINGDKLNTRYAGRQLIDQGYSPEWTAALMTPKHHPSLRRMEIAAHNTLTSWAGRFADRGPKMGKLKSVDDPLPVGRDIATVSWRLAA